MLVRDPKERKSIARRNKSNGMYSGPSMLKLVSSVKIFVFFFKIHFLVSGSLLPRNDRTVSRPANTVIPS